MLDAIWWLLTIEVIGAAAFPIAYRLVPRLADRGFSVARVLGVLVLAYPSWLLARLHLVPATRWSLVLLLLLLVSAGAAVAWPRRAEMAAYVRAHWRVLAAAEAVFLVVFAGWTLYRAFDPSISHTEKPMDLAFLTASIRTYTGAPEDPWLSGHPVSYYYFGHWSMGALSELAGIRPGVAYNLALSLLPALAASAAFGLVLNLARAGGGRLRHAAAGGLAASLLLTAAGNLEGVFEFARANAIGSQGLYDWVGIQGLDGPLAEPTPEWRPTEWFWWWRATRVINTLDRAQWTDYTIQEFPFFSFMLGDLHAHVMAIPLALLFLAFCLNYLTSPAAEPVGPLGRPGATRRLGLAARREAARLAPLTLALGGLAFTNVWEMPAYGALLAGVVAMRGFAATGGRILPLLARVAPAALAVVAAAILLFLPYYVTFTSQFSGIHPVGPATTRPTHFLLVWGLPLALAAPMVLAAFWKTTVGRDWARLTVYAIAIGFAPYVAWAYLHLDEGGASSELLPRLTHVLPLAMLVALSVYSALWLAARRAHPGAAFALAVAGLGLLLVMAPELVYAGDFFGTRMNTVFKLYYQGWTLLSLASGYAVYAWAARWRGLTGWTRALARAWAAVMVVLLATAMYYPLAAASTKASGATGRATLDGLRYVEAASPAEYNAIEFLWRTAPRGATLVEAVGDDYSDFGRVSAATGVPTVLGWIGHELQWRGSAQTFEGRQADVASIYQTLDSQEAKTLLDRYLVDYVYVGERETRQYGAAGLDKLAQLGDVVFREGNVVIYRVRR